MDKATVVELVTKIVLEELKNKKSPAVDWHSKLRQEDKRIPVGVSNRHVHLSETDIEQLFGTGAKLTHYKDLSQPGQYACQESITLVGPKGVLEKVRVLGPVRKATQVEIAISDCFKLGIKAPIRDSGDLEGSASVTLVGPKGSCTIPEGCIIAGRHIHMHTSDAAKFNLKDGARVSIKANGPRPVTFGFVLVRVSEKFCLEFHLDTDEANAVGLKNNDLVELQIES
ncbi:phosphate propanoyltransferase [Desulfotomaculum sp. 1211_IL3151]|uniref:phosphate propanoyltransferase n=1 Tax=Desulfotomaculum sp. 1211_IL3151 TaxID=3084055 RepID=UPI003FA5D7F8